MNKPKKPNTASLSLRAVMAAFAAMAFLALPESLQAFQLKDVNLVTGPTQSVLKLTFTKSGPGDDGEYPLYFQKADPSRGTLTLSFLDTESPFALGRHAVETPNPALEEVLLKRVTSPSGKSFLGIELRLKEPPAGEVPVQPQPPGSLKVMLGKGGKGKANWSLAQAVKARESYLAAKAEAPPAAPAVTNKVEAQPPEAAEPVPASRAQSDAREAAAPEPAVPETAPAGAPASLKEIRLAVTRSQEDVSLIFDPASATPVHTAQTSPADSTVLEVILDGVSTSLPRKDYVLPGSGLFKRVRVSRKGGNLVLRFQLASKDPVHILPREGGLTLTGGGKGESAVPFKWTSAKPDAAPPAEAAQGADPVRSAHEEGAAVDASAGAVGKPGKGLSSSRIFSLGKGGKSMMILKDSAALKSAPGPKAKTQKKIPLGERVERLDRQGAWIKVIAAGDTGFLRATEAAYEDEMTEAQSTKLRKDMEAAAARIDAQRKQAELASVKEAEAAAAALAQAQKAPEAPVAAEEAEPVRVAGPAAAPASKAIPEAAPPEGNRKPADGPRLSLAESPELAEKLAQEKKRAEEEKMRVEPSENRVAYNSYGRRDPFIPVEQGLSDNGIDIDQMKVVGIIWQSQEPMAVLEHNRESGVSFTVKQGDPVHNGRVSRITRDQVTFDISEYGISRSYSLKLVSNKEGKKQ